MENFDKIKELQQKINIISDEGIDSVIDLIIMKAQYFPGCPVVEIRKEAKELIKKFIVKEESK